MVKVNKKMETLDEWLVNLQIIFNESDNKKYRVAQFNFPDRWNIDVCKNPNIQTARNNNGDALFVVSVDSDYSELFKAASEVILYNQENDEKEVLLETAIDNLKKFFSEHSLEQCNRLQFTVGHKKKNRGNDINEYNNIEPDGNGDI